MPQPNPHAQCVDLRLQVQLMLLAIIHNPLQQLIVHLEPHAPDVLVMLQLLPLETPRVVPVDSRDEDQCVLVALPGVVVEDRSGHLYDLVDNVARLLKQLSLGVFFVVIVFGHACGELERVAVNGCAKLYVHDEFRETIFIKDEGDDVYGLDPAGLGLGGGPEYFFVVVDSFVCDGVVNVLESEEASLVDDFLPDYFAGLMIFLHTVSRSRDDIIKQLLKVRM